MLDSNPAYATVAGGEWLIALELLTELQSRIAKDLDYYGPTGFHLVFNGERLKVDKRGLTQRMAAGVLQLESLFLAADAIQNYSAEEWEWFVQDQLAPRKR